MTLIKFNTNSSYGACLLCQTLVFMLAICSLFLSALVFSLGPPEEMSQDQFDNLMSSISNWGRWGEDDQLGTLNTISLKKKINAAKLVRDGHSISLSLPLNTIQDEINAKPFEHTSYIFDHAELEKLGMDPSGLPLAAGDVYAIDYHGLGHSHLDAVSHVGYQGKMYNGYAYENNGGKGFDDLGVEHIASEGIFTRGVLVDIPEMIGETSLEPGLAVTVEDLEAWEKHAGIKISRGDVLLLRTGRWKRIKEEGGWNFAKTASGFHASVATWLKERDVAAIGCDGISDVMPSGVSDRLNPLHELVIVGLGMPMLDNLYLEELADFAKSSNRDTFLFIGLPLKVVGGTGSPLNPLAVF